MLTPDQLSKPELDVSVRREDVADAFSFFRKSMNTPREAFFAIGGLALTFGTWLSGLASDSTAVVLATFAGGWIVLGGLNLRNYRRYSAAISRLGLSCPHCREPMIEMIEWRGRPRRADMILASGRCPMCGGECFAPDTGDRS